MARKTLKELKDRVDVVQASQLDLRLGNNTLISRYVKAVDDYLVAQMKSARGHISLPSMQLFMDRIPTYKEDLVSLYVEKMSGIKGYELVNVQTMIAQAALFDSLCFVYDSLKDDYFLATMNFELLYDLDVEYDMLKQVYKKNLEGIAKAYRIDVEYNNSDSEFTFKAVNARDFDIDESKPDTAEDKRFFLVPYLFSVRFMKIVQSRLEAGATLRVHQSSRGSDSVRFISMNKNVLASMCDVPDAVKGVQAKYFPLKGFFYAPSVGAPSTSSMVTNVNIFNVMVLKGATEKDFVNYKVHKPVNPLKDMLGSDLVVNRIMFLQGSDLEELYNIVSQFPYKDKFNLGSPEDLRTSGVVKYLHSLPETSKNKVYKLVGVEEELDRRLQIFYSNGRVMTPEEIDNLEETLKHNKCRLILQKKDCRLSSVLCTNDMGVLRYIYGNNFVKDYESFSYKFYMFLNWFRNAVESGIVNENKAYIPVGTMVQKLDELGLPSEEVKNIWDILDKSSSVSDSYSGVYSEGVPDSIKCSFKEDLYSPVFEERLKGYFADKMGVSVKRSNAQSDSVKSSKESGIILTRGLSAYLNANGVPVEYYKNIDKSKILSGIIF